jgi:hypothetical protein
LIKGTISETSQHRVEINVDDALVGAAENGARSALSAQYVDVHQRFHPTLGVLVDRHSLHLSDPSHFEIIRKGGVLFSFSCSRILEDPYDLDLILNTVNLSCFADETTDNYVPHITRQDLLDSKYTNVIAKACYLLPGADLHFVCDPAFVASSTYQQACQSDSTYVADQVDEVNTFRMTRTVIPLIYYITFQFRVSALQRPDLDRLSNFLNLPVDGGLLLERTKRSKPPKQDRTRKTKSVLLYTKVPAGLYVTHLTVALQSSIPAIVAGIIHRFGGWGLAEVRETIGYTRQYLEDQRDSSIQTKGVSPKSSLAESQ